MTIDEIYEALRGRGLVPSLRRFSRAFLGRAENYAADRGLDRCSPDALLNLHHRLGDAGQADLQAEVRARLLGGSALPGAGDRKSTRLNSSHANISYAVFCLKKKTTKGRSPAWTDVI